MFETWRVGVVINATSNVARIMGEGARATMSSTARITENSAALRVNAARQAALREQMAQTNRYASIAKAGFTALAVAAGGAIYEGIKGAADLQQAMMSVAVATNTATNQMGAFYKMAFQVSGSTAQNATTIAREMAMAASSGLGNPKQLMSAFPRMARAADVMWLSPKQIDPVESIKQMSTLSHLFGVYSGKSYQNMLDRTVQMMFAQPEGVQQIINQGRMFIGAGLGRGVTQDDLFKQTLTLGQTGFLKGRGGAGLARVIEYLAGAESVTDHMSKVRRDALRQSACLTTRAN